MKNPGYCFVCCRYYENLNSIDRLNKHLEEEHGFDIDLEGRDKDEKVEEIQIGRATITKEGFPGSVQGNGEV